MKNILKGIEMSFLVYLKVNSYSISFRWRTNLSSTLGILHSTNIRFNDKKNNIYAEGPY